MVKSIRDTLDEAEQQLQAEIEGLRAQLAPLERELADVRLAKAALGPRTEKMPPGMQSVAQAVRGLAVGRIIPPQQSSYESPYGKLTMKELVVKALREHFKNGATARQLLSYFADAWGRTDISRTSLSPQLSRLKVDGVIDRRGNTWRLIEDIQLNETPDVAASGVSDDEGGSSSSTEGKGRFALADFPS